MVGILDTDGVIALARLYPIICDDVDRVPLAVNRTRSGNIMVKVVGEKRLLGDCSRVNDLV